MSLPPHTTVEQDAVVWRLPEPGGAVSRVRLWTDFDLGETSFARSECAWELRLPHRRLPPVDRLEYLYEVTEQHQTRLVLDPTNSLRVGGAFGEHSWLPLGYRAPGWLDVAPVGDDRQPLVVTDTPVGDVHLQIWSPHGAGRGEELPLLMSHDGPEMDALGGLTRFVGAMIAAGRLAPMRVALLAPGSRDERYAANPAYAEELCGHVLPAVREAVRLTGRPVLMGQSLGALAALHAEWTHPGTFAALFLQSGSFFTPTLDAQESGYAKWQPVTQFVAQVRSAEAAPTTLPVGICFGSAEDNAANNRLMAAKLTELGCPVRTGEVRDGHNFTCWRDLLDPHLVELLGKI